MERTKEIPIGLYNELDRIGLIPSKVNEKNMGKSDYTKNLIQPWVIFNSHPNLNYQECDIIKRILRTKEGDSRLFDLEKCKHILDELIRKETAKEVKKMDNKSTIIESIVNGQRKQAWEQMIEFNIGLRDIAQEIGLNETMVMLEIGINNDFLILKEKK